MATRSRALLALALCSGLLGAACGSSAGADARGDEADLTGADDKAMIALSVGAQTSLFVKFPADPSTDLSKAMITAAQRGVRVRGLLPVGSSHDTTWLLQQHLESSGVDVDVRTDDAVPGVLMVADSTTLVKKGATTTLQTDKATLDTATKRFTDALDPASASHRSEGLIASETLKVLPMPDSSRARIVDLLGAATSTIDLEIYQLQDLRVVTALTDAATRRVTVRVMLEPKTVGAANFGAVSAVLKGAGIDVRATPPAFDSSHNVDHAKFCILDGKELLFGTGNMVRSGLGGVTEQTFDNRDFWVEDGRSASIREAQEVFDADFAQRSTASLTFENLVLTPDNADTKIVALIDAAKKRLFVYNQELGDAEILTRLIAAKKRGVDVRVLAGFQPGFGGPPKNQAPLDQLTAAGISAGFLRRHYLHGKGVVSDSRVYLGSQNFSNGGLRNNRELGEILDDPKLVETVAATFLDDVAHPQ